MQEKSIFTYKVLIKIFFFFLAIPHLSAQTLPKEDGKLNYRLIGFSFPQGQAGCTYKIEIATGNYYSDDSFKKNIIRSIPGTSNKIIGEVPSFGKDYTWRRITYNHSEITKSELHHFSTIMSKDADTGITRLRILKPAQKYNDAYVFIDGAKALYDMGGKPVWFLPQIEGIPVEHLRLGDLKLTPQGTITFLSGRRNAMIYEVDYNGAVLWKGPGTGKVSGDSTEHYNHEFTRLYNGHYMVLGFESVLWKLPSSVDSSVLNDPNYKDKIIRDSNNAFYQKIFFYTVIEYDEQGNVVWALRTSKYFNPGDNPLFKTTTKGIYDDDEMLVNSFYFDEKDKAIYLSFRDIGRVFKVQYPQGNILSTYGNFQQQGNRDADKDLFCWQHDCNHSRNGYIYLFNNNICHPGGLPKITIIQDQSSGKDTLKKLWEYECTIDGIDTEKQKQLIFSNGGSVFELPDSSLFGCMSNQYYTKVFIVNRKKEIVWSAFPERWDQAERKWHSINQYKASMILNHKDIERLIWNTETVKNK